jgi:hypothetical protein
MRGLLEPLFRLHGYALPAQLRCSCGWPSKAALSRTKRRIGECWTPAASDDATTEIFISPVLSDAQAVTAVLVHELVHAAIGLQHGHGRVFKRCAQAVGLTGPMRSTVAGPHLVAEIEKLTGALGHYPHATLDLLTNGDKKQGTRLLKAECPACGYTVRLTQKWLDVGLPTCPCGTLMAQEI